MNLPRRTLLAAGLAPLIGCAADPAAAPAGAAASAGPAALATRWRSVNGGFFAPPTPGFGLPMKPGSGMFVKLMAPAAIALRGNDLLVADLGSARLWRLDIGLQTISGVAGAPVSPLGALALGPDFSAWVLDAPSRQVLRFGRDGRLLQTFRAGAAAPSPSGLALADGGATLLLADAGLAQWAELRSVGAFATAVLPAFDGGRRVSGVDALAPARDGLFVLDRAAGLVHQVARDGRVRASLGAGELKQPVALAADRFERVFVVDAQDNAVVVLRAGEPAQRLSAARLGVQQIGGIAVDERVLAVSDRLLGQVQLLTLRDGGGR